MERRYRETDSNWIREEFENTKTIDPVDLAQVIGFGLKPSPLKYPRRT